MKKLSDITHYSAISVSLASLLVVQPASAMELGPSALPDSYIPMITEEQLGERTAPIFELGDPFLDTGRLADPIILPTGAVWTPTLWVFGGFRTALAQVDNESSDATTEWANRLDLFANLQLSGTERVVLGITPIHEDGNFSKYTYNPEPKRGWNDASGFHVSTFFMEGELAELFPNLDPEDKKPLDIGFAVGRQNLDFQDGMLVNDTVDSIGIVKNNVYLGSGISNARFTLLYGWNEVNRDNNKEDEQAELYGLSVHTDFENFSLETDLIYIDGEETGSTNFGDSLHIGLGFSQRFGRYASVFRIMTSDALDRDSAAADDGTLVFGEVNTSPIGSENILYATGFWSSGHFTSASRHATVGGPLGKAGLLFASAGLGSYKPALSNRSGDISGGAIGYQMFSNLFRSQLIVEAGFRNDRSGSSDGYGVAVHLQHRLTNRLVWRADGYLAHNDDARGDGYGIRTELRVQF